MVAIYIEAQVEYKPNKMIKNKIFIDSGADMCLAKKDVLIAHKWKRSRVYRIKAKKRDKIEQDKTGQQAKTRQDKTGQQIKTYQQGRSLTDEEFCNNLDLL